MMYFPKKILNSLGLNGKGDILLKEKPVRKVENKEKAIEYSIFTQNQYISFLYYFKSKKIFINKIIPYSNFIKVEIDDNNHYESRSSIILNSMFNPTLKINSCHGEEIFFLYDITFDFNEKINLFVEAVNSENKDVDIKVKLREKRLSVTKKGVSVIYGVFTLIFLFLVFEIYLMCI